MEVKLGIAFEKLGRKVKIELIPVQGYRALWKVLIYRLLAWKKS
jgi:hypothetical protein